MIWYQGLVPDFIDYRTRGETEITRYFDSPLYQFREYKEARKN